MKKISYLFLAGALLFIASACGNHGNYYNEPIDASARYTYEHSRRNTRGAIRRGSATGATVPEYEFRQPASRVEGATRAPGRVLPHSTAQPQGQVIPLPDARPYIPAPQAMQAIPTEPDIQYDPYVTVIPRSRTNQASTPAPSPAPASAPAPGAQPNESVNTNRAAVSGRELASHKTQFDAKDDGRATNITRASNSINGHVVKPGENFSYNETVGPTIERRGYKEGVIFVEGEKKKGFGGGVCQVSTTLSIAADEAGMTITERHDHSRPVSYAKEGEEAATSYGGIDFKFKNEKPFPIVIKSSVEGGTVTVSICEG